MKPPEAADPDTLAGWHRLADVVENELRAVGLPVCQLNHGASATPGWEAGAMVDIDPHDGVYVQWKVPEATFEPVGEAILSGRYDDPHIDRYGHHLSTMNQAITSLLVFAGFGVDEQTSSTDLRPVALRVTIVAAGEDET
jgi:hypothetical protein